MRLFALILVVTLAFAPGHATFAQGASPLPAYDPTRAQEIVAATSPVELHATIEKLVAFGTRHTLSDTKSDTRGIGAARRWVQARFTQISKDCGGCIEIVTPSQTFSGARVPQPAEVMDIVAIQRGASDPDRVVLIAGHLDSRVTTS